jgi:hypothetical protein
LHWFILASKQLSSSDSCHNNNNNNNNNNNTSKSTSHNTTYNSRNEKTIIKRPKKLEKLQQKSLHFVNIFGNYLNLFFMPIINLLKSKLNNNENNKFNNVISRCSSSYGNSSSNNFQKQTIEKFNLIEELFGDVNDNNNTITKSTINNYYNDDDNTNNFSYDNNNNIDSNTIKIDITESSSSSILTLTHLDGIDAIIPTQCLLALGMFCNSSINTYEQR